MKTSFKIYLEYIAALLRDASVENAREEAAKLIDDAILSLDDENVNTSEFNYHRFVEWSNKDSEDKNSKPITTIENTFNVEGANAIADHYGYFAQRDMLTEECGEAIQAVNKCRRCCVGAQDNFLSELADIKVLLAQMEHFLNEDKITAIANEKIARELKCIEKEKELKKNEEE